ncbi:P-II family nitrogen regulator [Thermoactinomyces mirandus]|uniref:P-II family nitrogen regulator n=1 Tax=Thermoactinomyces mirandus TaxID=2756294 RepID=UPI001FE8DDA0|nr:P-II family nitrogen regulator [Thermoactinomyces mirandus]
MNKASNHKLIVTIVNKGMARKVVRASKQAGAEGGTVLFGKGSGIHEQVFFLGIHIEPERELILTLVPDEKLESVLTAVKKAGELDRPGKGIGFVLDSKKVAGVYHLLHSYS